MGVRRTLQFLLETLMFDGQFVADTIADLGYTHVVWLPDSLLGTWEAALANDNRFRLVRICREGEAWAVAAGLLLGGMRPLVMMQITGFFESGDAFRNVVFDLQLPLTAVIGARSWLNKDSLDSAKRFALPVIEAWGVAHRLIECEEDRESLGRTLKSYLSNREPGMVLIAEGRM